MALAHVVITGASSGIGAATARRYAKASNFRLTLIARRREKLEDLQKELGRDKVSILPLDVTSRTQVAEQFASLGPVDILVNNAGAAFGLDRAQTASLDDWEKCIDVNIKGLVYCTHAVLPGMAARNSGHIINLGSVAGNYPYPGGNVYAASKAFVRHFTLNLKADLLSTGIRVTCIEPGLTSTEFSLVRYKGDTEKAQHVYENTKPLLAEDIAEAIYFCTSQPPHININTLEVMPVAQAFAPFAVHRTP